MSTSESNSGETPLTIRLRKITIDLQELERTVVSGNLDPRVLNEFRNSVDHIRKHCLGRSTMGWGRGKGSRPLCRFTCSYRPAR